MRPAFRSIIAVLLGVVVAFVLIFAIEYVGQLVYPLPEGVDPYDREAMANVVATLPLGTFLFVLLAYGLGTLAGGWLAAITASRAPVVHGLVVGVLVLAFGIANLVLIPHPLWFVILAVAIFLPAAYAGALLARIGRPMAG